MTKYDNFIKKHYPKFKESWQIYQALAERIITIDSVVLSIGAGHQSRLEQYLKKTKLIIGIDPDEKALKKNIFINKKIVGLAEKIPLDSQSVDIIIIEWVMEHLYDPQKAFSEMSRVLKPNGKILFVTPNIHNPVMFTLSFIKKISNKFSVMLLNKYMEDVAETDVYPAYYKMNDLKTINRILTSSNMHIINLKTTGNPGYFHFSTLLLWFALQWEKLSSLKFMRWSQAYFIGIINKK